MISKKQKKHHLVYENGIEFYTIEGMSEVHSEMLRLLKIIDRIARENNISYWIAGGSMIGVARHHGFIPWDDDLDIELLKHDYIKLIECLTDYSNKHNDAFIFFQYPQDSHCCNYFASTRCFLRTQGSPYIYPAKVDIRPYNCIKNTEDEITNNLKNQDVANNFIFGKTYSVATTEDLKRHEKKAFFRMYNSEYGLYDPRAEDAIFVPPYFEYSMKFDFKYEHIFPLIRSKFEDFDTNMPCQYDYILKSIYGNYMDMPQIHHRVPAACEVFIKELPVGVLKDYCKNTNEIGLGFKIKRAFFLLRFHGLFNFIKYRFLEKNVVIDTNYEEALNNW